MITGIGVDLCSISRIRKIMDRDGPDGPFFRKTFTAAEQKEAESRNDKAAFYAARFAAKEAVFNALSDLKNCTEKELTAEEMRDSLICIEILNRKVLLGVFILKT